jgi:hypothetical protein
MFLPCGRMRACLHVLRRCRPTTRGCRRCNGAWSWTPVARQTCGRENKCACVCVHERARELSAWAQRECCKRWLGRSERNLCIHAYACMHAYTSIFTYIFSIFLSSPPSLPTSVLFIHTSDDSSICPSISHSSLPVRPSVRPSIFILSFLISFLCLQVPLQACQLCLQQLLRRPG